MFSSVPALASSLKTALGAVDALARDPAATGRSRCSARNDLATFGGSAFVGLGAILRTVAQRAVRLQRRRAVGAQLRPGSERGRQHRAVAAVRADASTSRETFQAATPAADLHINPYPSERPRPGARPATRCTRGAQLIGDPGQTSTVVDNTAPPPGVLATGQAGGARAMSRQPRSATPGRRRRRLHPLAISLIAIAATVFVIFYAFNQGLPFVHHFTLYALVNNSVNVRADSPVRIAGHRRRQR